MTNNEYQQLVDFLGRKFTEVDARLDQMATTEELQAQQAETRQYIDANSADTRRHFEVVAEGLRVDIRQVAEGHQFLVDGQARTIERIDHLERELGAMIRFSYAQLERRIQELEGNYASLKERVERVEARQG